MNAGLSAYRAARKVAERLRVRDYDGAAAEARTRAARAGMAAASAAMLLAAPEHDPTVPARKEPTKPRAREKSAPTMDFGPFGRRFFVVESDGKLHGETDDIFAASAMSKELVERLKIKVVIYRDTDGKPIQHRAPEPWRGEGAPATFRKAAG